MKSYDVAIVGGGMIGLTLALALKDSSLSVALIDTQRGDRELSEHAELRVSAISVASERIFSRLGVWQAIIAGRHQAYEHMSVWDKDSFAQIHFDAAEVQQTHLGHIIENQQICRELWQQVEQANNIELLAPCKITKLAFGQQECFISLDDDTMLTAALVVGADGANSFVRQQAAMPLTFWDYDHQAIVATVRTEYNHQQTARQIFTPTGPLAFLPLWDSHQCSIVWSQQVAEAEGLMALDDKAFSQALSAAFDGRLGICEVISDRQSYPLKMRYARQWIKDRVALVGDAAHTIHPLAGQGANLGLLDAAALAEQLLHLKSLELDIGLGKNLRAYERWRKSEAVKMIASMEGLKRLFQGQNPVKKLLRDVGLTTVNKIPFLKQNIIQQAMGLDGELPKLAEWVVGHDAGN
jgi:2-polyprenylphenol 6-hydroxylase